MKTVTALYPTMDRAREGMDALEAAGVEGASISVGGRGAARAAVKGDTSERDRRAVGNVGKRAMAFGLAGTALGALIGLGLGLAFLGTAGTMAATIGGAVAMGGLGVVWGGLSRLDMAEDWELTQERNGQAVIRLEARTDDELRTGLEALRKTRPQRLEGPG